MIYTFTESIFDINLHVTEYRLLQSMAYMTKYLFIFTGNNRKTA